MPSAAAKKASLRQFREHFFHQLSSESIQARIHDFTQHVDQLIVDAWQTHQLAQTSCCLIAVGGYGRKALLPYSDIDLLLLVDSTSDDSQLISRFIDELWDCGLEIGHSVTTQEEILTDAASDITIFTNCLEHRLLCGSAERFQAFSKPFRQHEIMTSQAFFSQKCREQHQRYKKYNHTSRNLEPDIKHGPGGLRDIQMIVWSYQYHFKLSSAEQLADTDLITPQEVQHLMDGYNQLALMTGQLQAITHRRESRLLFDYQPTMAKRLGYTDTTQQLAVEQFMQAYYRMTKRIRQLNDVLLQLLRETLEPDEEVMDLDDDFVIHNRYLDIKDNALFERQPEAILKLFITLCKHPNIKGVKANTIRILCELAEKNPTIFRERNRSLFITLLRQDQGIADQLSRMNRYGLLGHYIPEFEAVIGQMQYDLFHVYTVDHHSITTVRNVLRFSIAKYRFDFPLCAEIIATLSKREVLLVAALFHDMGKGQGGDHAEIGAQQVRSFCQQHHFTSEDTALAEWLVRYHLLLSLTAQRKDIYDPNVILEFAELIPDQRHLDHLYCLTVADVCATNPSLWNAWRDTLLRDLYLATKQQLASQAKTINEQEIVLAKQHSAREMLAADDDQEKIHTLWRSLPQSYFMQETPSKIAWHSHLLTSEPAEVIVKIISHQAQHYLEVFVYSPQQSALTTSTTILANHHLNILEARLSMTSTHHCVATYIAVPTHDFVHQEIDTIHHELVKYLNRQLTPRLKRKRLTREQRHFRRPPTIQISTDPHHDRSIIQIVSSDRPGLLAQLSQALYEQGLIVHNAKITTLGDKVEDIFYVTQRDAQCRLAESQQAELSTSLARLID